MTRRRYTDALLKPLVLVVSSLLAVLAGLATASESERISLAMRDAQLSEVMEMLSRQERINILLTEGVSGRVSFSLFDVSLDQAIRTVANAAGYAVEVRDGSYFVVDHDEAGKYVPDGITRVQSYEIRYADPLTLRETLTPYLSAYGKLTLATDRRLLIVEDTPEFIGRISALVRDLDREPKQILIEAKILEVTLDDEDAFGLDWARLFDSQGGDGKFGTRGLATPEGLGLFFNYATPDVEATLSALTARGRVRTLSTPKLLALENQESSVIIGDRRGYQVTTTINQVTSETIEFLESGVILRVTPAVDDQGRVMMEIHPEVSNGTVDANGIPSQTTTEVTTNLIVPSGKTIFIGGLIKHTLSEISNGIPVLGDLPGLGRLFSNSQKLNKNTETVVLITPHIVDRSQDHWNQEQQRIVADHETIMNAEQVRIHRGLNKRFVPTGVDLSRYKSLRIDPDAAADGQESDSPAERAPAEHTLYLFHAYSEGEARRFVAMHGADPGLRYYPTGDGNRFVLVYGRYQHPDDARSAIEDLPPEIARLRPDVRMLKDIAKTGG